MATHPHPGRPCLSTTHGSRSLSRSHTSLMRSPGRVQRSHTVRHGKPEVPSSHATVAHPDTPPGTPRPNRAPRPPRAVAALGWRTRVRRPGARLRGPPRTRRPIITGGIFSNRLRVVSFRFGASASASRGVAGTRDTPAASGRAGGSTRVPPAGGAWGPETENISGVRAAPRLAEGHVSRRPGMAAIWWGSMGWAVET